MTTTARVMSHAHVRISYIHVQQLGVFSCLQRVMFGLSGVSHVHLGCVARGDHTVALVRCFITVSLSSPSQVPGGQCPVVSSASRWEEVPEAPPPSCPYGGGGCLYWKCRCRPPTGCTMGTVCILGRCKVARLQLQVAIISTARVFRMSCANSRPTQLRTPPPKGT